MKQELRLKTGVAFSVFIASIILPIAYTYFSSVNQDVSDIILSYRFYRSVYTVLAGIVLASSGCMLQSTFRNPLVDHHILGVGAGALFAVYLTILIHGYSSMFIIALAASAGGLLALSLSVGIAEVMSGSDAAYVLSGLGVTSMFSGLSILLLYYVAPRYGLASLMLTGSFVHSRKEMMPYVLTPAAVMIISYFALAKKMNTVVIGDDYALQLGVNPRRVRLTTALIVGVSSSLIVSIFGMIGFIGLVTPHMARLFLKTSDNRLITPLAMGLGSLLLYVTDLFSRTIAAGVVGEIPAGAVTSAVGAPFFLTLLIKRLRGV
ncbi:iron ABC transporter permease [Thermosphaera chiliense]|uniref:Iron ABC transporter permease n=1 Tax=Thermosphaera chiliense TaxID=3402707 RepID=A0A7M1URW5_9CREN|nr:iron ABC transporter permease [Thermosphaera aggregans]QOR94931.1 iron ABC transporter permease [Thermosphaera aggregans]